MTSSSTGVPSGRLATAVHQAAWALLLSEHVLQQVRSGVGDFRLITDVSGSGHRDAQPDDQGHPVELKVPLPAEGATSSLVMLGSGREGSPKGAQKRGEILYDFAGGYLGGMTGKTGRTGRWRKG